MSGFWSSVSAVAMAVSPPLPFVAQYMEMRRTRSSEGFSTLVPLLLLTASALRLAFWFGKRYSAVLLVQSALLAATQLALLRLAVTLRTASARKKREEEGVGSSGNSARRPASLAAFFAHFWAWDDFALYAAAFGAFLALCLAVGVCAQHVAWLVELLGAAAVVAEALLAVPQIVHNHRARSVAGVAPLMVAGWFAGDAFKTVWFATTHAPVQFLLCGIWQLFTDCVLAVQFLLYRNTPASTSTSPLPSHIHDSL